MAFNYSKLRGKIKEMYGTQQAFSEALGVSSVSVSDKLNNKTSFSQPEIMKSVQILKIEPEHMRAYFFTPEVQKTEQEEE